ncbi:MAG: hypothetical protein WCA96_14905 [Methylocella sp.]
MHIGTGQGRIGYHRRHVSLAGECYEHPVVHAHLDPAMIAVLHRLMTARPRGQIAPPAARPGLPQQRMEEATIVGAGAALALAPPGAKGLSRSH